MGWTTFNKPTNITPTDYFKNVYGWGDNHELLDIAIVKRNQCYMAVKVKSENIIMCFVYMLCYDKGYYNFGYKDMTEFCGPNISECPERILKLLSPLPDDAEFAKNWRERCYARIAKSKELKKIKIGDIVKVDEPVSFTNGSEYSYFKKAKGVNRWRGMNKIGEIFMESSALRFSMKNLSFKKVI